MQPYAPHEIQLRPATVEDLAFLRRVHHEAMRPHVEATWGAWDAEEQGRRFYESTDPLTHEVVELRGTPVGCQWVRAHEAELELVRLYLLPAEQGRGIGTELVRRICVRARGAGREVRLRVLRTNPAQRLYERLGFRVEDETPSHRSMRWSPRG